MKEGRYSSASDVVWAGLRLLEEEEAKLERLRAEIDKVWSKRIKHVCA